LKSIKSNIVAFAILATLIPSVGLGLMSFVGSQDVINKNVDYELSALAKDASSELTHWLRERVHDVRTLSTAYTLIDGLGAGPPRAGAVRIGTAELALYLSSVQKKLDPLLELTLTDAGGQIIASSAASPATVALPQAWQSASITSGVLVAPPRWDDARATPTVTVAVPVLSPRNELLGALAAVLDLKGFEPRLRSVAGSSTAELVLVATDGTPLLSTKAPASALARLDPQAWTRLRGQSDEPLTYVDFQKHEVLGVAAPPGTLPIVAVAQRERGEVFAAWLDLVKLYSILVIGLTVLVGVVGYWLGRSIVTPLNALTSAADRVAQGDLSATLRDETKDEIGRLTRAFNLMTDRLRSTQGEIESANDTLRRQNEELETLATTDSLTGLYNRKKLDDFVALQFARFLTDRTPFALLMVSLDNLNVINTDYGLPAGDDALIKLAAMLRQSVREGDQVARFGGDRFVIILANVPFDAAMEVAEHLRERIEAPDFRSANLGIVTSVSIGVAQSREGDVDPDTILFRADHALHEAKRAGGNRVQSAM